MQTFSETFSIQTFSYKHLTYYHWSDLKTKYIFSKKAISHFEDRIEPVKVNDEFVSCLSESNLVKLVRYCNSHPEHLNGKNILFPKDSTESIKKFRKKDETRILSYIYQKYRSKYLLEIQKPFQNFKADCVLSIKSPDTDEYTIKLFIEVDENGHSAYDKEAEEVRNNIEKAYGVLVRFSTKDRNTYTDVISKLEAVIQEQKLLQIKDFDFDQLEKEIEKRNICLDFYKVVKPTLQVNKGDKYKMYYDDVVKYLEYANKNMFYNNILSKLEKGVFWIERTFEEHLNFKSVFNKLESVSDDNEKEDESKKPSARSSRRNNETEILKQNKEDAVEKKITNKRYIYLSPSCFLQIIQLCNKPRAVQARIWLTEIYFLCFNLVSNVKNKIIDSKKDDKDDTINAIEAMKIKQENMKKKYTAEIKQKNKEIEKLKNSIKLERELRKKDSEEWKKCQEVWIMNDNTNQKIISDLKEKISDISEIDKKSTKDHKEKEIKLGKIIRKMLITDLKKLCKNTRCIRGYSGFKSPEKESLETLILESIEKDENLRKKVIDYLKSNEYI